MFKIAERLQNISVLSDLTGSAITIILMRPDIIFSDLKHRGYAPRYLWKIEMNVFFPMHHKAFLVNVKSLSVKLVRILETTTIKTPATSKLQ